MEKDLLSYDAEYYEGNNDGDYITHLNTFVEDDHDTEDILQQADEISASINILHQQSKKEIFSLDEIQALICNTKILKMCMNTEEKQMDSGANKNVTNDKSIIRNYSQI